MFYNKYFYTITIALVSDLIAMWILLDRIVSFYYIQQNGLFLIRPFIEGDGGKETLVKF